MPSKMIKGFLANFLRSCFSTLNLAFGLARAMALFGGFTRTDTDDSDDPLLALHLSYSIVKMEGANF